MSARVPCGGGRLLGPSAADDRLAGAIQSLREDARHLFAFFNAPVEHREYVRTTNPIERTFREVRRWRRGCGAFADAKACDRVFNKVSMLLNERWRAKDLWNLPVCRDQTHKAHLQALRSSEDDAATRVRTAIDPRVFDMP
jgi:transposase-like protein